VASAREGDIIDRVAFIAGSAPAPVHLSTTPAANLSRLA
jgi:hypothetical protein